MNYSQWELTLQVIVLLVPPKCLLKLKLKSTAVLIGFSVVLVLIISIFIAAGSFFYFSKFDIDLPSPLFGYLKTDYIFS